METGIKQKEMTLWVTIWFMLKLLTTYGCSPRSLIVVQVAFAFTKLSNDIFPRRLIIMSMISLGRLISVVGSSGTPLMFVREEGEVTEVGSSGMPLMFLCELMLVREGEEVVSAIDVSQRRRRRRQKWSGPTCLGVKWRGPRCIYIGVKSRHKKINKIHVA